MKFYTEKTITNKIIIALVIVTLLNFICPNISSASIGGILFEPIKDLLLVIPNCSRAIMCSFLEITNRTKSLVFKNLTSCSHPISSLNLSKIYLSFLLIVIVKDFTDVFCVL